MRNFSYITVKNLLNQLKVEGVSMGRATFYRLEEHLFSDLAQGRTLGGWRVFSSDEAKKIKAIIKRNYKVK